MLCGCVSNSSRSDLLSPATPYDQGYLDTEMAKAIGPKAPPEDSQGTLGKLENEYYGSNDPARQRAIRDQVVFTLMHLSDVYYVKWKTEIYGRSETLTTSLESLNAAMTATASIARATAAKIISAVATSTSAANISIQKNIFQQQAVNVILSSTSANRQAVRVRIETSIQQSDVAKYPLGAAELDVMDYVQAGSLEGALESVQQNSGTTKATADTQLLAAQTTIGKPTITTQPADQTVKAGDPIKLSVVATGTPALTYQWALDGKNIGGATDSGYTVNAGASTFGKYSVTVTNTAGSVTSNAVSVTEKKD